MSAAILATVLGRAAGPGVYEGPARVVLDLDDMHRVRHGDVLVTPFTTPDITVVFDRARAIVTDHGGMLSHAALLARERGLPAVVGTKTGTKAIPNGARVRVDGMAGVVTILPPTPLERLRGAATALRGGGGLRGALGGFLLGRGASGDA